MRSKGKTYFLCEYEKYDLLPMVSLIKKAKKEVEKYFKADSIFYENCRYIYCKDEFSIL